MTQNYVVDMGTTNERITTDVESAQINKEIHEEFNKEDIQVIHCKYNQNGSAD